jgi:hypothetical protein
LAILRRREIYIAITLITGFLMVGDYFIDIEYLNNFSALLRNWTVILAYFAIVIGLINSLIFHGRRVQRKRPQWYYSAWLLFVLVTITFIGVFAGVEHPVYSFLFTNVYGALGPSGYGIMTFFIASAAFRALRATSWEGLVLVLAVIFTLMYRAPVGVIIPFAPEVGAWINEVPSTGGMRGIIIGMAIGTIGMGLRTLLGYERGYIGTE